MELNIRMPEDLELQRELMFNPKFFDVDALIGGLSEGVVPFDQLNDISDQIQRDIQTSSTIEQYALEICAATRDPGKYAMTLDGVDIDKLVNSGVSPRGMGMLIRAAKVAAWLKGRDALLPEDLHEVVHETIAHRVFFNPVYELHRGEIIGDFMAQILNKVASP